nr:helix-turn-helix domain-containing protein [Lapillicoccus jejuensis]
MGAALSLADVDLPRVTGRHRNRSLASARRAEAIRLRMEGKTYQQIAEQLGYRHRGTVQRLVSSSLAEQNDDAAAQLRQLESDRLDALLRSVWDKAMGGDVHAVAVATSVVLARVKLLGLDVHGQQPTYTGRTVVLLPQETVAMGLAHADAPKLGSTLPA